MLRRVFLFFLLTLVLATPVYSQDILPAASIPLHSGNYNNQDIVDSRSVYGEAGDEIRLALDLQAGQNAYVILDAPNGDEIVRFIGTNPGYHESPATLPVTGIYEIQFGIERPTEAQSYLDNSCYTLCLASGNSGDCALQCTSQVSATSPAIGRLLIYVDSSIPFTEPQKPTLSANASIAEQEAFLRSAYWIYSFTREEQISLATDLLNEDPDNLTALAYRAHIYRANGDLEAAQADLDAAFEIDPNHATSLAVQARIAYDNDDFDTAQDLIDEALRSNRNEVLAHYTQGLIYQAENDLAAALEAYTDAITADDTIDGLYYQRARMQRTRLDAIRDTLRAAELDPSDPSNVAQIGYYLNFEGQFDYGRRLGERAQLLAPNYSFGYFVEGDAYSRARIESFYPQAIDAFTQAINISSEYAVAYRERGAIYRRLGEYDNAIADFSQAIDLNPNDSTAISWRALSYIAQENYTLALADADRLIELDPNSPAGYTHRMTIFREQGDMASAREACREARSRNGAFDSSLC